ncbi:MAG: hypothetical protein OQK45_06115, partial [Sulfurovum sp.]|nr:hypothetical protein [Sulfurovum sp.]
MKKYLWAGIAVLFMSANASGFKDLDNKANAFLSDLRKSVGDQDLEDEEEIKEESIEPTVTSTEPSSDIDGLDDDLDAEEPAAASMVPPANIDGLDD